MTDPQKGRPPGPIARVVDSYHGVPCDYVRPASAPIRPGEVCGQIHTRCTAHLKASAPERAQQRGDPCRAPAMEGQVVCRKHGGGPKHSRAAGAARVEAQRARGRVAPLVAEALAQVQTMSGADQLLNAIHHAGAMALSYRWLLDELPVESQWSWEEVQGEAGGKKRWVNVETAGLHGPDAQGVGRLHAYEEAYRYWTSLHGKLLVEAAKVGLDERRQAIAETQVQAIGAAIRIVVAGLGRDLDDPTVVPVVEAALRALTAEVTG